VIPAGAVVAWWEERSLLFGVVAGDEKGKLRVLGERGDEHRVRPTRVAFRVGTLGPPGSSLEERRAAGGRVEKLAGEIRVRAAAVDVELLWELVLESEDDPDLGTLADLALGSASGPERAAVTLALATDGVRFVRRGDDWDPRPAPAVEEILAQRRREADKGAERDRAIAALIAAARGEPFESEGTREETRYLRAIEELAVCDLDASERARGLALEILDGARFAYDRPHEGAFRFLRRLGRFDSDDENLQIQRYQLRTEFSDEVLVEAAERAEHGFDREGRTDLTSLDAVTIDGPSTREIDDALSLERGEDGRLRLGIHIADPGAFVAVGGVLDREALARTVTYYLPDRRLPMLPESISEDAASLVAGLPRPALSFFVDIDAEGEIGDFDVTRSVVAARARLDYAGADRQVTTGDGEWAELLRGLSEVARRREGARGRTGAILLFAPEVDLRVAPDGEIAVDRIDPRSPSRRIVSEAMIIAGALAARFCIRHGLPAIYRRQPGPTREIESAPRGIDDPVEIREVRRSLRRGEVGLQPEPHYALGLEAYAQATSPLRRYQDLATHRQIASALDGRPAVYDAESLQRIVATTERAEAEGRRAESAGDRYWSLRYIEQRRDETLEAVVVATEPRPIVQLSETLLEQPAPSLAGLPAGERVRLAVVKVNPRADVLVLRPADPS
jgi:exoribonuclease-2